MRYVLRLSYCGTRYHGWQKQHNARTVQAELDEALSTLLRESVETVGCGRTDTGVHASYYLAHFDTTHPCDEQTVYRLNKILPADIAVKQIHQVSPYFHARFDATMRAYEYRMHAVKDPFLQEQSWYYPHALNVERMNEAAAVLMQYTNFQCFSKSNTQVHTYDCNITRAEWQQQDYTLRFYIEANRFLRNMVRAVVGTLLDVGNGSITLQHMHDIIRSGNRSMAGQSVPAHGLFLCHVHYEEHSFDLNRKSFALEPYSED